MIRLNLDQFFTVYNGSGDVVEPIRSHFHCDFNHFIPYIYWSHKSLIEPSQLPLEQNKGILYSSLWKNTTTITVSGIYENDYEPYTFPVELYMTNVSLLKSQLQKCVRRKHTQLAVVTAWTLMKVDFKQFIRRIAIIMNEDVYLHTTILPVIIWITSACTHGYKPSLKVLMWLLGVVKGLCETKYYDPCVSNVSHDNFDYIHIDTKRITDHEVNFLYSLLFRRSFGGLKNDMVMINNSLHEWHIRFLNKFDYFSIEINDFELEYVCPPLDIEMTNNHIIIPALDFHVYPSLLDIILTRFENILNEYIEHVMKIKHNVTKDDIQEIIWHFNSGINVRNIYYDDDKTTYNKTQQVDDDKNELLQLYKRLWNVIKPEYYVIAYKKILSM